MGRLEGSIAISQKQVEGDAARTNEHDKIRPTVVIKVSHSQRNDSGRDGVAGSSLKAAVLVAEHHANRASACGGHVSNAIVVEVSPGNDYPAGSGGVCRYGEEIGCGPSL